MSRDSQTPYEYVLAAPAHSSEFNVWDRMFTVGTAGSSGVHNIRARLAQGALLAPQQTLPGRLAVSTKNDVEIVISQLQPSMMQLASAFGVTRKAVYDWRAGNMMSAENTERLRLMVKACEMIVKRLGSASARVGDRQLPGGKTFWETIASGATPSEAAEKLIGLLEREQREREIFQTSHKSPLNPRAQTMRPLFADKLFE